MPVALMKTTHILPVTISVWGFIAAPRVGAAASQQPALSERATRSAVVTAITSAITIDGAIDELAWRSAPKIGELTQRQPQTGEPPSGTCGC